MEDKKKEPCENKAQDNPWSVRNRYEYLKKMSELAINTLAENELALNDSHQVYIRGARR